jgi:AGCS family alanine or glycine:cation symporter
VIGGLRSIAAVSALAVPFMAIGYVGGALVILGIYITDVPAAFMLILEDAFTGTAVVGGFTGAAVLLAIQFDVARGIFSNEAGLGSAPFAPFATIANNPVEQGTIALLVTFIDKIIVCTMTALVIIMTGPGQGGQPVPNFPRRLLKPGSSGAI